MCLLVAGLSYANTAEAIAMSFGVWTRGVESCIEKRRISFESSLVIDCCTVLTYVQNYANIVGIQ